MSSRIGRMSPLFLSLLPMLAGISVARAQDSIPVAGDDSLAARPGLSHVIDVLANDTDEDGKHLTVINVTSACSGTVINNGDGTLQYIATDEAVNCQISYGLTDDPTASSPDATAAVNVIFGATTTLPSATMDTLTVPAGTTSFEIADSQLLANDQPAGDLRVVGATVTSHGALSRNGQGNGYVFQPTASFWTVGSDSFAYTVEKISDPSLTDDAVVSLVAESGATPPTAVNDGPFEVPPGSNSLSLALSTLLANDAPQGDLTIESYGQVQAPSHGSLQDTAFGVVYHPSASFWAAGTDSFSYTLAKLSDPSQTAVATIFVVAGAAADPPVAVDDGPFEVPLGSNSLSLALSTLLVNDAPQGDLTIESYGQVQAPSHGSLQDTAFGVVYHPSASFWTAGSDAFSYTLAKLSDPSQIAVAMIFVEAEDEPEPEDPVATFVYSCSGLVCTFDAAGSENFETLTWDFGDGSLPQTSQAVTTAHEYAEVLSYTVTLVATSDEASDTDSQNIDLPPFAAFSVVCDKFLKCSFDAGNSVDDTGIESYQWDFGDGSVVAATVEPDIEHSYETTGFYAVTLTLVDDGGQTTSVSQNVSAEDDLRGILPILTRGKPAAIRQ